VVLLEDTLAIFHGCLAQAFFAMLAVITLLTAPRGHVTASPVEPALKGMAVLAAVLVYVQIAFGALLTHAGRIDLHLAGAALVFVLVPIVAARLRRTGDAVAAPVSRLVAILLGIQLLLGIGSFLARFSPIWVPGEQLTVTVLPVAHRLVGSLVLAATVVLAVRVSAFPILAEISSGTPPRILWRVHRTRDGDTGHVSHSQPKRRTILCLQSMVTPSVAKKVS